MQLKNYHQNALNSHRSERIAKQTKAKKKTAIVFTTHKFMGQKELTAMGIVFCQLPWIRSSCLQEEEY